MMAPSSHSSSGFQKSGHEETTKYQSTKPTKDFPVGVLVFLVVFVTSVSRTSWHLRLAKCAEDRVGGLRADRRDQLFAGGAPHAGEAAERGEQRLAPARADAGDRRRAPSADRASSRDWRWNVIAKRCASSRIRWISSSAGLSVASAIGSDVIAREEQLFLLRDADGDQVRQPERLERVVRRRELSLAAVDQDQIGKRPAVLEDLAIPPQHDFVHRGEVVEDAGIEVRGSGSVRFGPSAATSSLASSDPELPVLGPLHPAVFADHHRRDGLAALDRGDVEALDASRNRRQVQDGAQCFERVVVGGDGLVEARLVGDLRVARGQIQQPALFAALAARRSGRGARRDR